MYTEVHGSVQRGIDRCVERCMEIQRGAWRYAEVHSRVLRGKQ